MSIDEEIGAGPGFERTPPNNIEAEQSVLGGMLLSKDAIADVIEILRSDDFYRPAHQIIFDVITDLYGRGEPADAVTVFDELQKRGEMARVGGAAYLHTLTAVVPTAANAGFYAKIVREQAVLRRLIEAGTRIVSYGYGGQNEEVDDLVDRAQAEIYKVTERRTSEDYAPLSEIMPGALDELEAIGSRGGQLVGVPTGFADLDQLTNGLHPGQMIVVAARPAIGKALALDTPLPTPTGWTTMGEVQVGDRLIGADGRPTRVVAATEVLHGRPCYEVEFSDGTVIVADALHQWRTTSLAAGAAPREGATPAGPGREEAGTTAPIGTIAPTGTGVLHGEAFAPEPRAFGAVARTASEPFGRRAAGSAPAHARAHQAAFIDAPRAHALVSPAPSPAPHAGTVGGRDAVVAGGRVVTTEEVMTTEKVVTTEEIAATLGRVRHAVAVAAPLQREDQDLPLPPYAFGVWLGAGHSTSARLTTTSAAIVTGLRTDGIRVDNHRLIASHGTFQGGLRTLGVLGDKHIPTLYLRASERQRRALLAGLLDTCASGTGPDGRIRLTLPHERLARDVRELILSLGHEAGLSGREVSLATSGPRFRHIVDVRPVPSRPVRCVQVDNADHLYLAGPTWIPTHNSTLGLDFARSAAIKHGMTTVIFSLEMSRNEIVMRLLSAEARVALHAMRSGMMTDDDWTRLARRMSEVAEAPLFIDDSPNMSMMEIRAKCRRLKQRNDLRFVVIDYLQLMSSPKKTESRQNEVSEISRAIKLLAKELEVPVIAISQLNRGPEQRTDKRPQVSDLRESGCLTAATRVMRADTGAEVSLGELLASGARDIPVWSLDERLKLVPRTMTHVFPSGVKEVYRVRLRSGREVEATGNHPFLTYDGWRALADAAPGTRVAVPRHVPAPLNIQPWDEDELILLAHLIGDGSFVRKQPIRYSSTDEANLAVVAEAAARRFGITAVRDEHAAARCTSLRLPAPYRLTHGKRNPIAAWLDGLGLFGLRSHEKFLPDGLFALPKQQAALFLRHLWATDGCVWWDEKAGQARIHYASTSRRLVDDVARLLLRFNVMTRVKEVRTGAYRPGYQLAVHGAENQLRFLDEIGVHGERGESARTCAEKLRLITGNTNIDTVPKEVWTRVREALAERGMTRREFAAAMGTSYSGTALFERAPGRERLGRVAAVLDAADLEMLATNDVFWDEIASIEPLGEQPVYDATVLGTHNFVANGISLHNSIEQDADMVILLHREDAYERESPRAGEADLIVAKHRNGPTTTVTVAFQGHYSRFVDMAQH